MFFGRGICKKSKIEKNEAKNGDWVGCFTYLTEDPKKQKMGWKAVKIKK